MIRDVGEHDDVTGREPGRSLSGQVVTARDCDEDGQGHDRTDDSAPARCLLRNSCVARPNTLTRCCQPLVEFRSVTNAKVAQEIFAIRFTVIRAQFDVQRQRLRRDCVPLAGTHVERRLSQQFTNAIDETRQLASRGIPFRVGCEKQLQFALRNSGVTGNRKDRDKSNQHRVVQRNGALRTD